MDGVYNFAGNLDLVYIYNLINVKVCQYDISEILRELNHHIQNLDFRQNPWPKCQYDISEILRELNHHIQNLDFRQNPWPTKPSHVDV